MNRITFVAFFLLFSSILQLTPSAHAAPFLCQNKSTKVLARRTKCKRGESKIVDLGFTSNTFIGRTTTQLLRDGSTEYLVPSGAADPEDTSALAQMVIPVSCKINSFTVQLATAPGAGFTRSFLIAVNGIAEGSACAISETNTSCSIDPARSLTAGNTLTFATSHTVNVARSHAFYAWTCVTQ